MPRLWMVNCTLPDKLNSSRAQRCDVTSKDREAQALVTQLEEREAGVADLFEFYVRLEGVYASASKATEQTPLDRTSNSTNQR